MLAVVDPWPDNDDVEHILQLFVTSEYRQNVLQISQEGRSWRMCKPFQGCLVVHFSTESITVIAPSPAHLCNWGLMPSLPFTAVGIPGTQPCKIHIQGERRVAQTSYPDLRPLDIC